MYSKSKIFRPFAMIFMTFFSVSTFAQSLGDNYIVRFKSHLASDVLSKTLKTLGLSRLRSFRALNMHKVKVSNIRFFQRTLKLIPTGILYIEKDYVLRAINTSDDPLLSEQKGLENINITEAWDTGTGDQNVLVAVTDTGFNFDHEDLVNQVWTNPNEIPGNGIDDDENGYVDDIHGWDFANQDNDPTDGHMHGSHVSGIITGEGNNGVGISGVNWKARILPAQFLTKDGSGSTAGAIEAIIYAADQGARVMNASWGGGDDSQALKDAIDYGFEKGMLFIAAAGNESSNNDFTPAYPAAYDSPGLLAIASSEPDGKLSSFSNYGVVGVDLVAPGGGILSTVLGNDYERLSGTSMASPMAAGVAALILSVDSELTPTQLRNAMLNSVTENSIFSGVVATSGQLDAAKALAQLYETHKIWPGKMTIKTGNSFQFSTYRSVGNVNWEVDDVSVGTVDENGLLTTLVEGALKITATDGAGNLASTLVQVVTPKLLPTPPPTGGCVKSAEAAPNANRAEQTHGWLWSLLSYLLPFMFLFFGLRLRGIISKKD